MIWLMSASTLFANRYLVWLRKEDTMEISWKPSFVSIDFSAKEGGVTVKERVAIHPSVPYPISYTQGRDFNWICCIPSSYHAIPQQLFPTPGPVPGRQKPWKCGHCDGMSVTCVTSSWFPCNKVTSRSRWHSWMHRPTGDQEVAGSTPHWGRQHSFVEIDHEIFSTVILSLPLIQEGQLSVSGKRMCTILVNCLED